MHTCSIQRTMQCANFVWYCGCCVYYTCIVHGSLYVTRLHINSSLAFNGYHYFMFQIIGKVNARECPK